MLPHFRTLMKLNLENWILPYKIFFLQCDQVYIYIVSYFAENKNLERF